MDSLNPRRVMDSLKKGTVESIEEYFPVVGKKHTLVAKKIYVEGDKDPDDIGSQRKARLGNRTWAVAVRGDFDLVNNETGKVVNQSKGLRLASLPQLTRRYSYIVEGNEYQVDNQWRLKAGVYTRRRKTGELNTQFNLAKGRGFEMGLNPDNRKFTMRYGTSNVAMLPVLKALGATDEEIREAWGTEIYAKNTVTKPAKELQKVVKAVAPRSGAESLGDMERVIKDEFGKTELYPETTKVTLGREFDSVDKEALLAASKKLLAVNKGDAKVDNRDSLQFKELWSINDFIPERIRNSARRVTRKLRTNVDRKDSPEKIVTSDIFSIPIKAFFTSTSLAQQSTQINPLNMVGGHLRTTLLGPGGVSDDHAVPYDAKLVNASHLGFLDPVQTPEGSRTGITLNLALGIDKKGKEALATVYDTASKKFVKRSPSDLANSLVAFPDQYSWDKGKPTPIGKSVTASSSSEENPRLVFPKDVDYIIPSARGMFSVTANLVPFLPSNQATRVEMAARHLEQAVSLKDREPPLVQTSAATGEDKTKSWEKLLGTEYSSHRSPVSGKVVGVSPGEIKVRSGRTTHTVSTYNNYPLNDSKAFIDSTPLVKVGDTVTKNQLLADTSFTKNGVLSMGVNLRIGYLPLKGLVYEDGIVISETASERLTSEHLHKSRQFVEKNMTLGKKKFRAHYPGALSEENAKKLDDRGVVKPGEIVNPGDVIVTALQKSDPTKEQVLLKGIHKALARPYKDRSVTWDKAVPGVVTDAVTNGREVTVYVKTLEKADIGDKLSGRHGNKGVITAVVPDEEMPRNAEGEPLQIVVNPAGVPGRINVGQVLETSLGKVAKKTGSPYVVNNFEPKAARKIIRVKEHYRTIKTKEGPKRILVKAHEREIGYQELVDAELAAHNLSATEELFDPETGKSLGQVLVGQQYVLKHLHTVDKKLKARSHGYGQEYDSTFVPKSGGKSGAQMFGRLGTFGMLAHGSTANIRDALTYKSDKTQDEVWTRLQAGEPLPPPKPAFAYKKFVGYLNALGVNVEKEGNNLVLGPLTDKGVLDLSNGALSDPTKVIRGKDLKPEVGGLFDEDVTGGPGGDGWSHIELGAPMPNPVFEKAIKSLLGLTGKEYQRLVDAEAGMTADGKVVPAEDADRVGLSAVVTALEKLDVKKELVAAEARVKTARRTELNKANKKVKYLRMLSNNNVSARDAYVLTKLPVLPPMFRPVTLMEGGDLNIDGINSLYRDLALLNEKGKEARGVLPDETVASIDASTYDAMAALMASGPSSAEGRVMQDGQIRPPGILTMLAGKTSPKHGYFQSKVIDRKQDLTMRSVIVPDINLHLDELGLPRKGAMQIFRPFVVREMVKMGYTPLKAREEIDKKSALANKALDVVVSKRPVIFKRDPVLHKFGVMGFKARLHNESAIHIHPLVVGGFNADFDGDTMAVFVPVSQEAVDETYKMMPSKNLFNEGTGRVMYQPTHEAQLGLYLLTHLGKSTSKKFADEKSAVAAAKKGDIAMTDVVNIGGKRTTAGRVIFNNALPKGVKGDKYLTGKEQVMGKKNLQSVLREVATKTPAAFQPTVDRLKDLGFGHAYNVGFSFSMKDFEPVRKIRDARFAKADAEVAKVLQNTRLSKEAKDKKVIEIYGKAVDDITKQAKAELSKRGNKLMAMHQAGIKPSWGQLQQMLIAPMLVENPKGGIIPVPVKKSYSEGLGTAGYWVASSGARKTIIEKVQSVAEPGALSKQIISATTNLVVASPDCQTSKGIGLQVTDPDIINRYTAVPVKIRGKVVPKNTQITPELVSQAKSAKVSKLVVRSSLKCEEPRGLCSKCYGVAEEGNDLSIGTNIGVISGQVLGEKTTQAALRSFHQGGIAGTQAKVMGSLDRITQLLKLPASLPDAASLAPASGVVSEVKKAPAGGYDVKVGKELIHVSPDKALLVKKGDQVKRGQQLSSGFVNPKELLKLTNMDTVQRYLTTELHKVFAADGVKKRNIEVVLRPLTNLAVVEDAGDSDKLVRGDFVALSHANALNRKLKNPIKYRPVLRGIETLPLDQSTDWLARLQYRRLKETLLSGAQEGWKSEIHGLHPTPAAAYSSEFGRPDKGTAGY